MALTPVAGLSSITVPLDMMRVARPVPSREGWGCGQAAGTVNVGDADVPLGLGIMMWCFNCKFVVSFSI